MKRLLLVTTCLVLLPTTVFAGGGIAVIKFLEEHDGGKKIPTLRECTHAIQQFPGLDRNHPQSADLVKLVTDACSKTMGDLKP